MVTLGGTVLSRYQAFSLYNSPYVAHADGSAIDLYPDAGAPSPIAGTVLDTRTVRAPPKPYAADNDHLIIIDTGHRCARVLHVDPAVEPGETVAIGDTLGELIRSGYFAPWVDNHIHLGFRPPDANPYRASGSLPIHVDATIEPVRWEGSGTVCERADTYVILDTPTHPAPTERFAGISAGSGALDGGLPHYDRGGVINGGTGGIDFLGTRIGRTTDRTVSWDALEVRVNGTPITGISLAFHRDRLGVKLVSWSGIPVDVGEDAHITIHRQ